MGVGERVGAGGCLSPPGSRCRAGSVQFGSGVGRPPPTPDIYFHVETRGPGWHLWTPSLVLTATCAYSSWAPRAPDAGWGLLRHSWPSPTFWLPTCQPWTEYVSLRSFLKPYSHTEEWKLRPRKEADWFTSGRARTLGHPPYLPFSHPPCCSSCLGHSFPLLLESSYTCFSTQFSRKPPSPPRPGQVPPLGPLCLCDPTAALVSLSCNCLIMCLSPPLDCESWEGGLGLSWSPLCLQSLAQGPGYEYKSALESVTRPWLYPHLLCDPGQVAISL